MLQIRGLVTANDLSPSRVLVTSHVNVSESNLSRLGEGHQAPAGIRPTETTLSAYSVFNIDYGIKLEADVTLKTLIGSWMCDRSIAVASFEHVVSSVTLGK